jgi:hypothetical protein
VRLLLAPDDCAARAADSLQLLAGARASPHWAPAAFGRAADAWEARLRAVYEDAAAGGLGHYADPPVAAYGSAAGGGGGGGGGGAEGAEGALICGAEGFPVRQAAAIQVLCVISRPTARPGKGLHLNVIRCFYVG